jgi:autotransporter translocation and assembly factor TamB
LKAAAAPKFDAAELSLAVHLAEKQLTLDATAKQPLIQPLTIAGRVPLDVEAIITNKKLDPAMPLDARLKMPPSSLAVLPKVVPAIRRIDGTAALDVHVGGTVEKPVFSGKAAVRLKDARMTAPNIPAIGNFTADLAFAGDVLNFETFRGEVGGGKFQLLGKINLVKLTEPVFDLQLKADDVLAMRDDTITLRTDAEVKFAGPLNAAAATGTVWITQSRFFKEIDILPIGLPGRPKPAPKSAPSGAKTVSFPNPPLRDMKFDIDIKTRDDDPFLIRGNMANGGVLVALHLGGTGLEPWLDGSIRFQDFTASLPFSALTISRGFVYFKKEEPFQATLDLQAESKIRDYTVGAYIYGKATDPQVQFTSEPPLPHADIVSLLATGTTTAELGGSADVLASRAAMLAVQSLYKKMFKKGGRTTPPLGGPRKDPGGASWLDRFDVEFGGFDNRTGGQAATARFKFNDQMYLLGELDTQGRYTGAFKYLLRFR